MTKIKICGLKRDEDIAFANELLPDYIGFVFAEKSKRVVSPEKAKSLKDHLDPRIKAVGVFVNETKENMLSLCRDGVIDCIQLHGNESENLIRELQSETDCPVIKAFRVETAADIENAAKSSADWILLDHGAGGTGEAFDWRLAGTLSRPFFLAGGLAPDTIGKAIDACHPYAVDVSSGVETGGVKDYNKMKQLVVAVRSADG